MCPQIFLKKCKNTWSGWKIFPRYSLPKIKRDRMPSNYLPRKIETYKTKYFPTNRPSNSNCCNWLRPRPPMLGNGPLRISRIPNLSFSHMILSFRARATLHWMRPLKIQMRANILRCSNKWISELRYQTSLYRASSLETLSDATNLPKAIIAKALTQKHVT